MEHKGEKKGGWEGKGKIVKENRENDRDGVGEKGGKGGSRG